MAKSKKSKVNLADLGLAILGGAIAGKVANLNIPMVPEKAKPALPLILGYFLSRQSGMMKAAGMGMIVVGGIKTINAFAPQLGIGETEGVSDYMIEGYDNVYALSGTDAMSGAGTQSYSLSGYSDENNSDFAG